MPVPLGSLRERCDRAGGGWRRRLAPATLGLLLLVGCAPRSPAGHEKPRPERGVAAAISYLLAEQEADGTWRSRTYAALDDGTSLTPLVLVALARSHARLRQTPGVDEETLAIALDAGLEALLELSGGETPSYPVYSATLGLELLSLWPRRSSPQAGASATEEWIELLRSHQLGAGLGWSESDPEYGGWGYARRPPRKPAPSELSPGLVESNLSATRYVLSALGAAGAADTGPPLDAARVFVERCQNLGQEGGTADPEVDDGGFFFTPGDPVRNKAGPARSGEEGAPRFRSYGSATADGLLALQTLGLASDHPRRRAARDWLVARFTPADRHPGDYPNGGAAQRNAPYFYYAAAVAAAFDAEEKAGESTVPDWRPTLRRALLERQLADGSWRNPIVDVREDDPLVATPLALIALATAGSE